MYTEEKLKEALVKVKPFNKILFEKGGFQIGIPSMVKDTAAHAFINKIPESEFTEIIREAYKDLFENEGCLKYVES